MKRNIKLFVIFLFFFLNHNSIKADNKIMFIDLDYVYFNSIVGKKFTDQIKEKSNSFNKDLNKKKDKINDQKKKLISQKNVLSEEDYSKKVTELEIIVKTHNAKISEKNKELQKFKAKARIEFLNKLKDILQQYANQNSIQMIINKKDVLVGKKELDVTKDILDLVNKNLKTIKIQ
jgi:outer membrane protein